MERTVTKPEKIIPKHLQHNSNHWYKNHQAGKQREHLATHGVGNGIIQPKIKGIINKEETLCLPKYFRPNRLSIEKIEEIQKLISSPKKYPWLFLSSCGRKLKRINAHAIARHLQIDRKIVEIYIGRRSRKLTNEITRASKKKKKRKYQEYDKKYRAKNKEKIKEYYKEYYEKHKNEYHIREMNRRLREKLK